VRALLRYQAGVLFRSHRWVFPLIAFVLLISVGGVGGSQSQTLAQIRETLATSLDWAAAVLVPVVALLTRSMLTAEPEAARNCVAAAAGPVRAHLSVLITALAGGLALAVIGVGYELVTSGNVGRLWAAQPGRLVTTAGAGLGKALICIFVGSAVAALCNRPVIRHQTVALLGTVVAVVVGLLASVSPATAALHGNGGTVQSAAWPTGVPFLVAAALLAVSWLVSAWLAARRSG
jgi:hypothetical protein